MRKYECLRTSLYLDRNLRKMNSVQKRFGDDIKTDFFPIISLTEKLHFYYQMIKMKRILKRAQRGNHVSPFDYFKLRDMWLKILMRKYKS